MKCKNCDGSGYVAHPYCPDVVECFYCDGTGVVEPLTNEEWIKQCTTEQLAEILVFMAENKNETKTVHKENVGKCVWWLKQPHTNE